MPTLTSQQIAELRELYEQTTQGHYRCGDMLKHVVYSDLDGMKVAQFENPDHDPDENAAFYTAIHNAFPSLVKTLAEKDALQRKSDTQGANIAALYNQRRTVEKENTSLRADLATAIEGRDKANERIVELERVLGNAVKPDSESWLIPDTDGDAGVDECFFCGKDEEISELGFGHSATCPGAEARKLLEAQ